MAIIIKPGRRIYDEILHVLRSNPGVRFKIKDLEEKLDVSRARVYFALKNPIIEDRIKHQYADIGNGKFTNVYWVETLSNKNK